MSLCPRHGRCSGHGGSEGGWDGDRFLPSVLIVQRLSTVQLQLNSSHKLVPVLATDLGQTYKLGCGPGENIFSDVLLCRGNLAKLFVFKSTRFNKNYQPK